MSLNKDTGRSVSCTPTRASVSERGLRSQQEVNTPGKTNKLYVLGAAVSVLTAVDEDGHTTWETGKITRVERGISHGGWEIVATQCHEGNFVNLCWYRGRREGTTWREEKDSEKIFQACCVPECVWETHLRLVASAVRLCPPCVVSLFDAELFSFCKYESEASGAGAWCLVGKSRPRGCDWRW